MKRLLLVRRVDTVDTLRILLTGFLGRTVRNCMMSVPWRIVTVIVLMKRDLFYWDNGEYKDDF